MLAFPEPKRTGSGITGEVVHVDRFGNAITNISSTMIRDDAEVICGSLTLSNVRRTYGEVDTDALLALIGSSGLLEIAVNGGSAANTLGLERGMPVEVRY
jgi:S-adenosylmethionine hydrolase